ncbi:MAG: sugar ABC transporter permease [Treponema sp.]|nr:sugar ABC transporter permease [Treponema sp.]MCL2271749.1 sugar ABC transporter permease [Treponema sp.]
MAGSKIRSLHSARQYSVRIAATVFLLPALLIMVVYILYPIINSFINSTMDWRSMGRNKTFTGLANWITLIKDINFWQSFFNNVKIMLLSLVFQIPFAMLLATFLDFHGKKAVLFKILWFFPYLLSAVVIGILFKFSLDSHYGIFGSISKLLGGGAVDLFGNPKAALYTVIGIVCWQYIPFYMVLYLAAYGTIPEELYEAASIDGATQDQYFWRISLPLLRPTIITGMTLSIIGSLKYFDLVWVMTRGGPGVATEVMATYMYKASFVSFNMGYGSTVASGMFILITIIALVVITVLNQKANDY